jgi:hypothetical protein
MPIDTPAKRRSAAGVPFLPLGPGVTPDGAKPVAWRQQSGWGYSGIPAGEAVVPATPAPATGTWSYTPTAAGSWSRTPDSTGAWSYTPNGAGTWSY